MTAAGYSGTPLAKKLGIKPGYRILTVRAPEELANLLAPLPAGSTISNRFRSADVALVFARAATEVDAVLDRVADTLPVEAAVWVCWPKKASGIASELQARDVLLPPLFERGYVDVKIAAISDIWSGMKFVLRKENR